MMNRIDEIQSTVIKALRFPLIVMVVAAHVLPAVFADVQSLQTGMGRYGFFAEMISHNLCKIAVPCFFVLSGYFFFLRIEQMDGKVYMSQLKKRVNSLLVPYVLWNIICIVCDILHCYVKAEPIVIPSPVYAFWTGPANYPFWYMRDLMLLTLLTPVFYCYLKYLRIYGWMALAIVYFTASQDYSMFVGLNLRSVFFFGTGVYMGMNKKNFLQLCLANKSWCLPAFLPLLLIATWFNADTLVHHYLLKALYVTGILAAVNMTYSLLKYDKCVDSLIFLSQTVFFIYGIHLIQIEGIFKGIVSRSILSQSGLGMGIGYVFIVVMTLLTCLIMFFAMKRICPRFLGVLVGKR